jgi:hypothetical protein
MTVRRFFTSPGDSLLLSHDPIETALRTQHVMKKLGLSGSSDTIASLLTRLPLPYNAGRRIGGGETASLRPRGNAASFWLPVWWFPSEIATRRRLDNGDTEGMNTQAVRLALELEASGLYDPESGVWIDVLESRGIDTTTDDGVARVQAWLDGGNDRVLSELERTGPDVEFQGRSALDSALWLQRRLFHCAWHDGAESLLDVIDAALDENDITVVRPVAQIASTWFMGCEQWVERPFNPTLKGVLALRGQLRKIVDVYADANVELVTSLLV